MTKQPSPTPQRPRRDKSHARVANDGPLAIGGRPQGV